MVIEKEIKRRARAALQGNASRLIAAAGLVALVLLLAEYLEYLALLFSGTLDFDTGALKSDDTASYLMMLLVASVYTALLMFVSPLLNGWLRMVTDVAENRECASRDVLWYFKSSRRYFRTVLFNFLLYMMLVVAFSALNIGNYLMLIDKSLFDADPGFTLEYGLTLLVRLASVVIGVLLYLLLAHYPLLRYARCSEIGVVRCAFGTLRFTLKNYGKLLRLVFSFAGWLALCFFVVPALYAVPYFAVASAISAKWLLPADGNGGETA